MVMATAMVKDMEMMMVIVIIIMVMMMLMMVMVITAYPMKSVWKELMGVGMDIRPCRKARDMVMLSSELRWYRG